MVKKTAKKRASRTSKRDDKYEYSQKAIFEKVGLSDVAIKGLRRDWLPDSEWVHDVGNGYFYTQTAKNIFQKHLNVDMTVSTAWLEAIRPSRNNWGLVCESYDKPYRQYMVTVKDASMFTIGKPVAVRNLIEGKDIGTGYLKQNNPTCLRR